jgi:hypothetical protein
MGSATMKHCGPQGEVCCVDPDQRLLKARCKPPNWLTKSGALAFAGGMHPCDGVSSAPEGGPRDDGEAGKQPTAASVALSIPVVATCCCCCSCQHVPAVFAAWFVSPYPARFGSKVCVHTQAAAMADSAFQGETGAVKAVMKRLQRGSHKRGRAGSSVHRASSVTKMKLASSKQKGESLATWSLCRMTLSTGQCAGGRAVGLRVCFTPPCCSAPM